MNKSTKTLVGVVLFLAIVLVAVGYAAITNVTLNINGTAQAAANQDNFSVEFTGTPTVSDEDKVTATIDSTDATQATLDVTGLTAKGDTVTATYTIKNLSEDLSASLATPPVTNDNPTYFNVTTSFGGNPTIAKGETTTLTVTVELLKTPIDAATEDLDAEIGVEIVATPVQP